MILDIDVAQGIMKNTEAALWAFLQLAYVSHQKQQFIGRDKFLIMAGVAACNAGWPDLAEECRIRVLENNASHMIGKFESFVTAMRDDDFLKFAQQLDRFCTFEKAEHLLNELGIAAYNEQTAPVGPPLAKLLREMQTDDTKTTD